MERRGLACVRLLRSIRPLTVQCPPATVRFDKKCTKFGFSSTRGSIAEKTTVTPLNSDPKIRSAASCSSEILIASGLASSASRSPLFVRDAAVASRAFCSAMASVRITMLPVTVMEVIPFFHRVAHPRIRNAAFVVTCHRNRYPHFVSGFHLGERVRRGDSRSFKEIVEENMNGSLDSKKIGCWLVSSTVALLLVLGLGVGQERPSTPLSAQDRVPTIANLAGRKKGSNSAQSIAP
jgi:hypothetical protein